MAGEVFVNGDWLETLSRWDGLRPSIDTVSRRPLMLMVKCLLRAVKNAIEDRCVEPGAGAFEVAAHTALTSSDFLISVQGRAKFGVRVSECYMMINLT